MEKFGKDFITKKVNIGDLRKFDNLKEIAEEIDSDSYSHFERIEVLVGTSILENVDKIKSIMNSYDELIIYSSPKWTWDCLAGHSGYAILRSGEIIYEQPSWMS